MKTELATNFSPAQVARARAWIEAHTEAAKSSRIRTVDIKRLSESEIPKIPLTNFQAALTELGYDPDYPKLKLRVFNSDAPGNCCRRHHILKCQDRYCSALRAAKR